MVGPNSLSTRRGGPNLTEDLQTVNVNANAVWPIYTSSCSKLTTNSSTNEEKRSLAYSSKR